MFVWRYRRSGDEADRTRSSRRPGLRPAKRRANRPGLDLLIEGLENRVVPAFVGGIATPIAVGTAGVIVADFNGDGKLDVATDGPSTPSVDVRLGNGNGTFGAPTGYFDGTQSPSGLVAGDFNGDGHIDVGVVGGDLSTFAPVVHVLLGNADGTFQAPNSFPEPNTTPLGAGYGSPIAADLNGDGKLDLVTTNPAQGTLGVLLGDGNGSFLPSVAYSAARGPTTSPRPTSITTATPTWPSQGTASTSCRGSATAPSVLQRRSRRSVRPAHSPSGT